jgi:hypothetical protein
MIPKLHLATKFIFIWLAASREKDLLLCQLAREPIHHILNELLLQGAG